MRSRLSLYPAIRLVPPPSPRGSGASKVRFSGQAEGAVGGWRFVQQRPVLLSWPLAVAVTIVVVGPGFRGCCSALAHGSLLIRSLVLPDSCRLALVPETCLSLAVVRWPRLGSASFLHVSSRCLPALLWSSRVLKLHPSSRCGPPGKAAQVLAAV
ncbi:hypothetical protein B0T24DRAFT_94106 [Lasiosphaeria ovina]|uniref:Uncharacterized protein n=1 Tax=Lasiosphaeria ovina TaxID=92902 RepID=A0AAE0NNI6_9PEZI|nr:hypothetical protein B0T24DRAFT_94106 [Lasiosphaeria ovina]